MIFDPSAPADIEVGTRDGQSIRLDLTLWSGITLTGPGAHGVARAWLSPLLLPDPRHGVQLLTTTGMAGLLFPSESEQLGLRTVGDADLLLDAVEAEMLGRGRSLLNAEVPDASQYRATPGEEPFPPLIAVVGTTLAENDGRWGVVLGPSFRSRIGVLCLPDWEADRRPGAPKVRVAADGAVLAAAPKALEDVMGGALLFYRHRDSGSGLPGVPVTFRGGPASSGYVLNSGSEWHKQLLPEAERTPPAQGDCAQRRPDVDRFEPSKTDTADSPAAAVMTRAKPRVTVTLLGAYDITVDGYPITTGLRNSARELLAWYLLHPDGASADQAVADLWPDTSPERSGQQFWNALSSLRSRLRCTTPGGGLEVIARSGRRYRAQTDAVDVDLWQFHVHVAAAAAASDSMASMAGLNGAAEAFQGELLAANAYPWVEPLREELHRRALDVHLRLARLQAGADMRDAALETLERTIIIDPLAEEAYRRILALQAHLGRVDAVQRTWRQLRDRLGDLDLQPEAATIALYRRIQASSDGVAPQLPPNPRSHPA